MDARQERLAAALAAERADWALLTGFDAVCYATGHVAPLGAGPVPFCGGPALAIVDAQGRSLLVASDAEVDPERPLRCDRVVTYEGFAPDPAGPPLERLYADAVAQALADAGVGGTVAAEPATFPASVAALVGDVADFAGALRSARAIKTREELDLLRACAELTAVGQQAARAGLRAGRSELEVFADVRAAFDAAAGGAVPLGADLLSGVARTAEVMGMPGARELAEGDPVIVDLVPQLDGYWGDSCLSWVLGDAGPEYTGLYRAAHAGLEAAVETLRPGLTAGEFAEAVYRTIEGSGHHDPIHIGHGIGTANFEYPKLARGATAVLEPGMVLMVEPGAFRDGVGGARLEWMFLVTEHGNEVLSPYPISPEPPNPERAQ